MSGRGICGVIIGVLVLWSAALPQGGGVPPRQPVRGLAATHARPQPAAPEDENRKIVDFRSDVMRPVKVGDSSYMNLLGNVILYHNGAIITCDSAIRYDDRRLECFGRVVINKDSTYIYGDRAEYRGEENTAHVFAPIIKMTDGNATLYTYNFSFNTLDNIGRYSGGGTMTQDSNLLESRRGYYYSDLREMIAVEEVELRNPDYRIRSDSVGYNMDTEVATFFRKTYIWNSKDEILSADRGFYDSKNTRYEFTSDAYILTDTREVWADSMDYNSTTEDALFRRNIQMHDADQKTIAFGDYGEWWGGPENAMLTTDPSLVSYDPKEDTLYMRADSMFLFTVPYGTGKPSEAVDSTRMGDEEEVLPASPEASAEVAEKERTLDSLRTLAADHAAEGDSLFSAGVEAVDSLAVPDVPPDKEQLKRERAEAKKHEKEAKRLQKEIRRAEKAVAAAKKRGEREAARAAKRAAKMKGKGIDEALDEAIRSAEQAEKVEALIRQAAEATGEDSVRLREQAVQEFEKLEAMLEAALPADTAAVQQPPPPEAHDHGHEAHDGHDHGAEQIPAPAEKPGAGPDPAQAAAATADTEKPDVERLRRMLFGEPADAAAVPADSTLTAIPPDSTAQDSLERVVRGYHDVRIFRSDFQAVCDSLVGFSIDSTFHLYIEPVLWNADNQITSELMDVYTRNQQIDRAVFVGAPIMVARVDSTHYNQIKGKVMESFFRNNDIYRTDVNGNGQTYYYMEEDDNPGVPNGFLVAECADITFLIEERKMESITWRGSPVYSIYPMDKIPPEQGQFLEGFQWLPERRPTIEDVFTRSIRPSERTFYETLPQPSFPLTDAIMHDKERMIRDGIWIERNDQIGENVYEFIRRLGYQ